MAGDRGEVIEPGAREGLLGLDVFEDFADAKLLPLPREFQRLLGGADTPGSVAKSGRTRFSAASCICPTVRCGFSVEKTR